jgi:hypothetical protein
MTLDDLSGQMPLDITDEAEAPAATPGTPEPGELEAPEGTSPAERLLEQRPSARTLVIESVRRVPEQGEPEELSFLPGVNLLVGPPNAGKSKWLRFIDFVLGDGDPPEATLSPDLAEKYRSASVTIRIHDVPANSLTPRHAAADVESPEAAAGEPPDRRDDRARSPVRGQPDEIGRVLVLERRWKEPGMKGKVFVDGDPMTTEDFGAFLLSVLGIPLVHYPKGDPYAPRAWPALSWRTLFRHLYREERFWTDLADRQPEAEQHASLMQFLGLAAQLFSVEYGELVEKRKLAQQLRAQKESYMAMLHQVTNDLGRFVEFSVAITPESLAAARARLAAEREVLNERRVAILRELAGAVAAKESEQNGRVQSAVDQYGEALAAARAEHEGLRDEVSRSNVRIHELSQYRASVHEERERLERAHAAGIVLAQLKVTDCPVCDRPVHQTRGSSHECYLCLQPHEADDAATSLGTRRIAFEMDQLAVEEQELTEVLAQADVSRRQLQAKLDEVQNTIQALEDLLRPTHMAAAAVLPPDLSVLDQAAGALDEQMRTLESVAKSLDQRDALAEQIDKIEAEAETLDAEVTARTKDVPFGSAGSWLEDGFNSYFNALNQGGPDRWLEGGVKVRLRKRDFSLEIQRADWRAKLGATLACFFLNAYHYALLSLSDRPGCNYPGLAIVDFPPTLADDRELTDEENYLIEPFIALLARLAPAQAQLIVAGRAFVDLHGANRIPLTTVYQ